MLKFVIFCFLLILTSKSNKFILFLNTFCFNFVLGNPFTQTKTQTETQSLNDKDESNYNVHVLPHHFFKLEDAKKKVLQLHLPHFPTIVNLQEKYIFMSSIINYSDAVMLQCLGALIKYLEMNRYLHLYSDSIISIQGLTYVMLKKMLFIDHSTKYALQIFVSNRHPSVYKLGKGKKEGSSLFSLFNRCSSRVGSTYLKKIFNRPLQNVNSINKRLNLVEFLQRPKNHNLVSTLKDYLKHVQDVNLIVAKMNCADLSINDWNKLYKNVNNIISISETLQQVEENFPLISKIIKLVNTSSISNIIGLISKVIDFKESFKSGRVEVKHGLDEDLDEKKIIFKQLPDILSKAGVDEYLSYQEWIDSCAVTYVTQVGYLLCVPFSNQQLMSGNFEIPNLELVYKVGNEGFYRSTMTLKLDKEIGDIFTEIYDKQRLYMLQLQAKVLESVRMVGDLVNACAKLDW